MEAIQFYTALNFRITPVKPGSTKGYRPGWSQPGHTCGADDFRASDCIGVLNGLEIEPDWFNYDVDIDTSHIVARRIIERLLPPTGWRYGRGARPRSHANYLVKGKIRTRRFPGIGPHSGLELRGITQKHTHTLSVAPGELPTE